MTSFFLLLLFGIIVFESAVAAARFSLARPPNTATALYLHTPQQGQRNSHVVTIDSHVVTTGRHVKTLSRTVGDLLLAGGAQLSSSTGGRAPRARRARVVCLGCRRGGAQLHRARHLCSGKATLDSADCTPTEASCSTADKSGVLMPSVPDGLLPPQAHHDFCDHDTLSERSWCTTSREDTCTKTSRASARTPISLAAAHLATLSKRSHCGTYR